MAEQDTELQELLKYSDAERYTLLDRMRSDCEYFLNNGHGSLKRLYAKDINKQIEYMSALWDSFDAKPEWLSKEDIESYGVRMREYEDDISVVETIDELKDVLAKGYPAGEFDKIVDQVIKDHCYFDSDKHPYGEVYWDYRDTDACHDLVREALVKTVKEEGFGKLTSEELKNKVIDRIYEDCLDNDWFGISEHDFYADIQVSIERTLEVDYDIDSQIEDTDWYEYLTEEKGMYFDYGLDAQISSCELQANLLFNFKDEWNTENTNIQVMSDVFERMVFDDDGERPQDSAYVIENNSLTWLAATQGYTVGDILLDRNVQTPFVESVREEYINTVSHMNQLTCSVQLSYEQYIDLSSSDGGNYEINSKDIYSHEYFMLGFFDDWNGGGSLLNIEPEKPFVISHVLLSDIQVEGVREKQNYTVNEVYGGLVGGAWSHCIEPTDKALILDVKVDYPALDKQLSERRQYEQAKDQKQKPHTIADTCANARKRAAEQTKSDSTNLKSSGPKR